MVWQGLTRPSLERFTFQSDKGVNVLRGLIIQTTDAGPFIARYVIALDEDWATPAARVWLENGDLRRLSVEHLAGSWLVDGQPRSDLAGCVDVDLEWTPATNTLPIRRLRLPVATGRAVRAAWVRFPSLSVEPLEQVYERLDERHYRYRSGTFTAELEVDEWGLIQRYGETWRSVAAGVKP